MLPYLTFSNTTGSGGTGSHAKPTMQPDQQHHRSLILQHINPKKKADKKLRLDTITNQNYVTTSKTHRGWVGGAGQAMADGNQAKLLNT